MSHATAVADLERGTVLARVDIAAPPERVFRALTTSEVAQWWGAPELYRTTAHAMDLRPGGAWRSDGVSVDGAPFHVGGEVLAVDAPRSLTFTWLPSWEQGEATTVTYRLEPTPTGTRVTVRHTGFTQPAACGSHANGWERVLGWLVGHVAPRPAWLCRLIAPRATFPADMTDVERKVMGEHVAYWKGHLADGTAVAFGPVGDPAGVWGLGLLRAADRDALGGLLAADPVIAAGLGFRYDVAPMLSLVT